jgi:hypothetical protein
MFKSFRKPKWKAIPANLVKAGDIVSKILIVGPVLSVEKRNIYGHDYVCMKIDVTEPGQENRSSTIHVLSTTLVRVIQK